VLEAPLVKLVGVTVMLAIVPIVDIVEVKVVPCSMALPEGS